MVVVATVVAVDTSNAIMNTIATNITLCGRHNIDCRPSISFLTLD